MRSQSRSVPAIARVRVSDVLSRNQRGVRSSARAVDDLRSLPLSDYSATGACGKTPVVLQHCRTLPDRRIRSVAGHA